MIENLLTSCVGCLLADTCCRVRHFWLHHDCSLYYNPVIRHGLLPCCKLSPLLCRVLNRRARYAPPLLQYFPDLYFNDPLSFDLLTSLGTGNRNRHGWHHIHAQHLLRRCSFCTQPLDRRNGAPQCAYINCRDILRHSPYPCASSPIW